MVQNGRNLCKSCKFFSDQPGSKEHVFKWCIVVKELEFRGKGNNFLFHQLIHNKKRGVIFSSKEKRSVQKNETHISPGGGTVCKCQELKILMAMFPDVGKHLWALSREAFLPTSRHYEGNRWKAQKVDEFETRRLVQAKLRDTTAEFGVENECRFFRVFGHLTVLGETFNLLNLDFLEKDPELRSLKHEMSAHWVQLAAQLATKPIPLQPGPVALLKKNDGGHVIGMGVAGDTSPFSNRDLNQALSLNLDTNFHKPTEWTEFCHIIASLEFEKPVESRARALEEKVRWNAANALGEIGPAAVEALPQLVKGLESKEEMVRSAAANAVGDFPDAVEALPQMVKALESKEEMVRSAAAYALGEIGPAAVEALPQLVKALESKEEMVRSAAAYALGEIGPAAVEALPQLVKALESKEERVRSAAANALGKMGPAAVPQLVEALKDQDQEATVRQNAAKVLGEMGPAAVEALPRLVKALEAEEAEPEKYKELTPSEISRLCQVQLQLSCGCGIVEVEGAIDPADVRILATLLGHQLTHLQLVELNDFEVESKKVAESLKASRGILILLVTKTGRLHQLVKKQCLNLQRRFPRQLRIILSFA